MPIGERVEEFVLAPDDPRWGDERARDEYYRGSAVGFWWALHLLLVLMVVAAAQSAMLTSWLALAGLASLNVVLRRYCRRHDVPLVALNRAFNSGARRWIAIGTTMPLILLWAALVLIPAVRDTETLAGAVTGAIVGGAGVAGIGALLARRERRRDAELAAADDEF